MPHPLVIHLKPDPGAIYIGRPNPFVIGRDGTRAEVIEKYRRWITEGAGRHLLSSLHELRGLSCWCAPQACHGEVLVELAAASAEQPQPTT